MSALSSSRIFILRLAKRLLLIAGLIIAIWLGVILWWQSSQRQISLEDVLIYLVALPLAVLTGFAIFSWLRARRLQDKQQTADVGMPAITKENISAAADDGSSGLPVLAAWGITSAGMRLDDFHAALIDKRHRPQPDTGLLNDYGYPVHSARVPEVDTSVVESELEYLMANNPKLSSSHGEAGRDGFLRALALLKLLVDQLSAEWPLADNATDAYETRQGLATLRGVEPPSVRKDVRLRVQLKFIIPADFTPAEQQLALSYLLHQVPALPVDGERLHIQMVPAGDEPAALLLADRFRNDARLAEEPQALLVLACDSVLCPVITERWELENRLFGSNAPQGLMPGEAAFAILCVNERALPLAVDAPAGRLTPVMHARRDESADSGRKTGHTTLDSVVCSAIAAAGVSHEEVSAIACDADHRSNRVLECINTMLAHTPHLDAIGDRLSTNEICGHTGAASNSAGWVAGIAHVMQTGRPVLLFNVSHAFERAAAVLLPASDEPQVS